MLQDNFARHFTYLRLSLTTKCNFKCQYCLPNGYTGAARENNLALNEIHNLATALAELGITKVRLTGGEPTLRRDLTAIIAALHRIESIQNVALTTNAYHLDAKLDEYIAAGLTHLNISLDSLNPVRFKAITQVDKLASIQKTLEYSLQTSLQQVKINTVLLQSTMPELSDFLVYIADKPLNLRFIELMQTNDNRDYFAANYLNAEILIAELLRLGWQELPRAYNAGPAREYSHTHSRGRVGVIAAYSQDFCLSCNRLRVTHDGALRLCLFGEQNYPLRDLLQEPSQISALQQRILNCLNHKLPAHRLAAGDSGNLLNLSNVGG